MSIYVALLAGCVLTMILGKFVLAELRKLKAGQEIRQDGPTWHNSKAGTPTMGGIAFILGSGIVTFACGWQQMLAGDFAHLYVYLFALIFGLIGFVDDYRKVRQHQNEGLTAKQKFVLQLLAAIVFLCLMRYEGLLTNDLYIPFVNVTVTVNWILYLIFAAFVIVGCVNAVNLTDGLDGLAAGTVMVVMLVMAAIAFRAGVLEPALFAGALAGACIGFLWFNSHPADIFMGDTGSLALGMALGCLAVVTKTEFVVIIIGGLFVAEALSVMIQVFYYKKTKKRIFLMAPLHHHFEKKGWSETKVVVRFWIVSGMLAACGFVLYFATTLGA